MKKCIALFLAVVLMLGCFTGCRMAPLLLTLPFMLSELLEDEDWEEWEDWDDPELPAPTAEPGTPDQTEAPDETQAPKPQGSSDSGKRQRNLGWRDYGEDDYVDMVSFRDLPYERPDVDVICTMFEDLAQMAERGEDADRILEAYYKANDAYMHFYTMDNLAYIRYTLDTNDSYYKDEYDALELAGPDIEEKVERFNKACAESDSRYDLEDAYFGEDYFADYEDFSLYTNEEYLALKKEEESLMSEYRSALEDPQIEFDGKTQSFNDLMEQYGEFTSYRGFQKYLELLKAYYDKYNPLVGEVYIKLVKIRQQIAEVLDYDSYADYCYEVEFGRDYTHADGRRFLDEIRTELVPVYEQMIAQDLSSQYEHFSMSESELKKGLQSAVRNMDPRMEAAYDYMTAYGLYDISQAPEKFDSSFTTYLYDWEAPFLTVNSQGSSADYVTFSHEFGHFTDYYVTYDAPEDLETAETFSQAMEFLSLCYTEGVFRESQRDALLHLNLLQVMDTFTYQAALASFEDQVYELPENQLTLKNLNELYHSCCKNYGNESDYYDFYYYMGWIDVTHFFEVPHYVISYCVSADTALQIYLREAEHRGDGLETYLKLYDREPGAGVQQVMRKAGLDNPFRKGGLQEIADFYREAFDLN